jgi:hypothetical protein
MIVCKAKVSHDIYDILGLLFFIGAFMEGS